MTWTTERKLPRILIGSAMLVLSPAVASAQVEGGVESIVTTTIASFALIIISILVLMIYRKVSQRRRDSSFDTAGLDLMRLKNKGLLTPEEMEKVSRSIARRMEEKEAARRRAESRPTPNDLVLDPEVRRLQALAEAREKEVQPQSDAARTAGVQDQHANRAVGPVVENVKTQPDQDVRGADTEPKVIEDDDIELPPEVQQLADAGVLTAEEIENVRRRLRARKQAQ